MYNYSGVSASKRCDGWAVLEESVRNWDVGDRKRARAARHKRAISHKRWRSGELQHGRIAQ